jgi:nitrite reductase (NADH) small subunit
MIEHFFANEEEIKDREQLVKVFNEREVGLFRLGDEYYAWENNCPHMGGPVCQGRIINRVDELLDNEKKSHGYRYVEEDVHIVCPWHGYEFNIRTGGHPGDSRAQLKGFVVNVRSGEIYVEIE